VTDATPRAAGPVVSVVVPVYNRAASIGPCLTSVQRQTFTDWECLVVDDGSDDGAELAAAVAALGDRRFRTLRRPNGGGGAARNTGIDAAAGTFVAFLDSDDAFLPEKLAVFLQHARADERVAWYSPVEVDRGAGVRWVRPDRAIRSDEPPAEYLFVANQLIQTSTLLLPTELAREVRFDPELRKGQDLDLVVRLAAAGVRFAMVDRPLTVWTDVTEANRVSRHSGSAAPAAWLEASRDRMSARAYHGYRATVLAYYASQERKGAALRHLVAGGLRGRVPAPILARQFARCFLPRRTYRRFVDTVLRRLSARRGPPPGPRPDGGEPS
jgi:glycosyltransferase involved in cell wall biosynthesis